jgi:hypothetical protein
VDAELLDAFETRDAALLRGAVCKLVATRRPQCVLHPLGFYFIRLFVVDKTSIRLHYWPAEGRQAGTAITPFHDHVWSLCSCIMVGSIENVFLSVDPDENGDFQLADITQVGNVDEVLPVSSRVRIHESSRQAYRVDEFYEIPPRVFHYTDVPPGLAAITVVRSIVAVDGGPRTLVPVGFAGQAPSRDEVPGSQAIIDEIAALLRCSE